MAAESVQTEVEPRTLRALHEYHSVLKEAEGLYTVVSQSGKEYTVDLRAEDGGVCSCPDHQHRGVECKHLRVTKLKTGKADTDQLRDRLASKAEEIEHEADELAEQVSDLRSVACDLRDALDRLEEVADA